MSSCFVNKGLMFTNSAEALVVARYLPLGFIERTGTSLSKKHL